MGSVHVWGLNGLSGCLDARGFECSRVLKCGDTKFRGSEADMVFGVTGVLEYCNAGVREYGGCPEKMAVTLHVCESMGIENISCEAATRKTTAKSARTGLYFNGLSST